MDCTPRRFVGRAAQRSTTLSGLIKENEVSNHLFLLSKDCHSQKDTMSHNGHTKSEKTSVINFAELRWKEKRMEKSHVHLIKSHYSMFLRGSALIKVTKDLKVFKNNINSGEITLGNTQKKRKI